MTTLRLGTRGSALALVQARAVAALLLERAGVTSENNAAPLVLAALGPEALPKNQPRDGITSRLGMSPLPDKGDYFQMRDPRLERPDLPETDPANDLDPLREATVLEFGEQAELARLRELHRSPCEDRRHREQPG